VADSVPVPERLVLAGACAHLTAPQLELPHWSPVLTPGVFGARMYDAPEITQAAEAANPKVVECESASVDER